MADPSLFTGRYDDALCAALGARGHRVVLAGRPLRPTDAIEPGGYAYAPRFFRWSERVPARLRRGAKAVDYLLDSIAGSTAVFGRADVIHWQWLPLPPADRRWLARLSHRHALVHTVHNARPFHGDGDRAAAQARGYFDLLARFDALVVHGEETAAALGARDLSVPVHIVPHPPMRLARASPAELAAVPPSSRLRLLFFGTIRLYKGVALLIEAAIRLWEEGQDFDLALAGQPFMDIAPLLERVRAGGHGDRLIADLGFLTEGRLDAHLTRADILVFPYRHIDSSGAFLSALDYGAAMVTSDCGMFARLDDGDAARFAAGDIDALAAVLRQLIAQPEARERLGRAAQALGARMSGWDGAAALTEGTYAEALARARGRGVPC